MKLKSQFEQLIKESFKILDALYESKASVQAKEMGLVSRGFGRYSKSEFGDITHKTVDGNLVKVTQSQSKEKVGKSAKGGYIKKSKKIEPVEPKKEKDTKKPGISDIQKIRGGNRPIYIFKYNGREARITLSIKEFTALESGLMTLLKIITERIKKKEFFKKKGLPASVEKQLKYKKDSDKDAIKVDTADGDSKLDNIKSGNKT